MMIQYIIRRILTAIPVLFGILLVTFALARLIPGDPCRAILGEKATQAVCDRFIEQHGLNKPIQTQFGIYLGEIAHGDFGMSFRYGMPVTRLLVERLPTTFELALSALFLSLIVGIPLGIISAVKHNSWADVGTMIWANTGVSMPVFWLGLMLAYVFSLLLKDTPFWLPPSGRVTAGLLAPTFFEVWDWKVPAEGLLRGLLEFFGRHEYSECTSHFQLGFAQGCNQAFNLALSGTGHHPDGTDRPHDPLEHARGARTGLHPHCPCQGTGTVSGDYETRLPQLPVAPGDSDRPVNGQSAGRCGSHRDHLWALGRWPHSLRCHHRPRLRHRTGLHRGNRSFLCRSQPDRGHLIRLPRPARPSELG